MLLHVQVQVQNANIIGIARRTSVSLQKRRYMLITLYSTNLTSSLLCISIPSLSSPISSYFLFSQDNLQINDYLISPKHHHYLASSPSSFSFSSFFLSLTITVVATTTNSAITLRFFLSHHRCHLPLSLIIVLITLGAFLTTIGCWTFTSAFHLYS